MLAYTYHTTETTRPSAKLTSRNFRQVFENDFVLVKIKPICVIQDNNGEFGYPHDRHFISVTGSLTEYVRGKNNQLFDLLSTIPLHNRVFTPELGNCNYLIFYRINYEDGGFKYRYALTSGDDNLLLELTRTHRLTTILRRADPVDIGQEVPEPIVRAPPVAGRRRHRHIVNREEKEVVPAKPKAINFTMNTECYICMMDFSEDPEVTMNSCCMKLAHTTCYSGIVQKSRCGCCRTTLE